MFQKFRNLFQVIVGKVYMGWQLLFDVGMKPCMMAHMDEIGLFGTNTSGSSNASEILWCVGCGFGRKAFITKTSKPSIVHKIPQALCTYP